jgi:hypothetical protein
MNDQETLFDAFSKEVLNIRTAWELALLALLPNGADATPDDD